MFWGVFGDVLGRFRTFLDVFGCFWDVLGHFGVFWGKFWDVLGYFETFMTVLNDVGRFLAFWDAF